MGIEVIAKGHCSICGAAAVRYLPNEEAWQHVHQSGTECRRAHATFVPTNADDGLPSEAPTTISLPESPPEYTVLGHSSGRVFQLIDGKWSSHGFGVTCGRTLGQLLDEWGPLPVIRWGRGDDGGG